MNQKIPHWSILLWFSPTPPPKSLLLVSTERNEEMGQVPRCSLKGSLVQVEFFWQARKFWLRWEIISRETCCLLHFHCFACTFHLTVCIYLSHTVFESVQKKTWACFDNVITGILEFCCILWITRNAFHLFCLSIPHYELDAAQCTSCSLAICVAAL